MALPWVLGWIKNRITGPPPVEKEPSQKKRVPPTLRFVEPDQALLPPAGFRLRLRYQAGSSPIDPTSLRVRPIAGGPRRPLKWLPGPGAHAFHADVAETNPFAHGQAELSAEIRDREGQIARARIAFRVDALPPDLVLHARRAASGQSTTLIGGLLRKSPEETFRAPGLQLSFLVTERPDPPDCAGLDLASVRLTADFRCLGLPPNTNLENAQDARVTRDEHMVQGWFMIDDVLDDGRHTFRLSAADKFGNDSAIDLAFATAEPELRLHLFDGRRAQSVAWGDEREPVDTPAAAERETFPAQGLKLTFRVHVPDGLPALVRGSVKLTCDLPPEIRAKLKKTVHFSRRDARTVEGFVQIDAPLDDGEHRFTLHYTDPLGLTKAIELPFCTARPSVTLVARGEAGPAGDRAAEGWHTVERIRAIHKRSATSRAGSVPGTLRKHSFRVRVVYADGGLLTLNLKCLGPNGETLWVTGEPIELKHWPHQEDTYGSPSFVVFENNPAVPLSEALQDWAIPAVPGSTIVATAYQNGEPVATLDQPVPVRIPRLEITQARIRVTTRDRVVALRARVRLIPRDFSIDEKPPQKLRLTVRSQDGHALRDQRDRRTERIAPVCTVAQGRDPRELQVDFDLLGHRDQFKPSEPHRFEIAPAGQRKGPLEIPPRVIRTQPAWFDGVEIDVLRNVQQTTRALRPVNPYANVPENRTRRLRRLQALKREGLDWQAWAVERPRGISIGFAPRAGERYAVRVRGIVTRDPPGEKKAVAEKRADHPWEKESPRFINLGGNPARRLFEWNPRASAALAEWDALKVSMGIAAKLEVLQWARGGVGVFAELDGTAVYQTELTIELKPRIDRFEIRRATLRRGAGQEVVEHPREKVRLTWGDHVTVDLQALAHDIWKHAHPAVEGLPLTLELETPAGAEGYGFILRGKATGRLSTAASSDEEGRVTARFRVPDLEPGEERDVQRVNLVVRTETGDRETFPFLAGGPTIAVTGPKYALVGSRPTYRVRTDAGPGREVTWALYAHGQAQPVDRGTFTSGEGEDEHPIRPTFKTQADTIDYANRRALCHRLVVRCGQDEVTVPVRVAKIGLLLMWDAFKLGRRPMCFARTAPYALCGTFTWHWQPPLREMAEIPERRHDKYESQAELPRIGYHGRHRLKVAFVPDGDDACGGERVEDTNVKPMAASGPEVLAPDETGTFFVSPAGLEGVEWFVYTWAEAKRNARKPRSGLGEDWAWKPGATQPGGYTLKARWDYWEDSSGTRHANEPSHDVVVGEIVGPERIPLNGSEIYHASPRLLSGYRPEWRISFYDDAGEDLSSDTLTPDEEDRVTVRDDGRSATCRLEADFGQFEGMAGKVVFSKRISLGKWRGEGICQWRLANEREA